MKLTALTLCLALMFSSAFAETPTLTAHKPAPPGSAPADPGPLATLSPEITRANLAADMKLVADWQLTQLPAQPQYDWTFAALYAGMMSVPPAVSGDKYRDAMYHIGDSFNWEAGPRLIIADDESIGQMYLEQYMLHHDPKMLGPIRARIDEQIALPNNPARILWYWCDALFMEPPVLADLYSITGDQKYLQFLDRQWYITTTLLYSPTEHLYFRDSTFLQSKEKNGKPLFWSRGNGWVMAGIVRVLDRLPADSPYRAEYIQKLREMAAAVAKIQSPDGLWRPGLLDADSYPLPEVSGSAFITYALAYGVNHKLLPAKTYNPVIRKAWAGMLTHVYADGRLGAIQPVGAAPAPLSASSSYVYGVGAFLLAGSELYTTAK